MKKFMILLMAMAMVVVACKKDDDDDDNNNTPPTFEEKLVGKYVFTSGTFNEPITMYNVMQAGDTVTLPAGTDATVIVASVLLGDSPCDNASNTALEMRDDFSLFYICLGESNEEQMGTWTADGATSTISLNVNSDLGPIAIPITDVTVDDDGMGGNITTLPVPIDLMQPVGATNMQFANVAVVFTKLPL